MKHLKKFLILMVCMLSFWACSNSEKNAEVISEGKIETVALAEDFSEQRIMKDIYDVYGEKQGCVEIYDDYIKYCNEGLRYSIELPKCWEDNFIVKTDYQTKYLSIRFLGESKEGKGIYTDGNSYGLELFQIIYEVDFEYLMYEHVLYLGTVDEIKLYYTDAPDFEIGAVYDEIFWYDQGMSDYQDDEDEIAKMREDIETLDQMINSFSYEDLNFQIIE